MDDTNIVLDELIEIKTEQWRKKMANEQKIRLIKWIEFSLTCLTIIGKVVKEIIQNLPEKN